MTHIPSSVGGGGTSAPCTLIDEKILGWDPVGNIQDAGPAFIGVIAFVVLYLLFIRRQN